MKTKMEILLLSPQTIFTVDDLSVLWKISDRSKLWESIKYYLRTGRLRSIQRGVYSTVDDYSPLEAAIKIFPPAYISFITALAFHGAYFQYTDEIHVMGQTSKRIDLPGGRPIIYHQLKKEMLLKQNGVYKHEGYWIASLERAICDTSYLEPSFVFENVDKADADELERLSQLYDNRALSNRIQKLTSTMLEKEE
jgi:predicted transcriptional regulator of viral defense system